jgi:hypothetical protein
MWWKESPASVCGYSSAISGGSVTDAEAEREIRAIVDRLIAATLASDRETLGELLADGSTHIGTDPDEWWTKEQLLAAPRGHSGPTCLPR